MGPEFFSPLEDGGPVDGYAYLGCRPVAFVVNDFDLGLGQPLQLVEAGIVAQIFSRRIRTVQGAEPESKINHATLQRYPNGRKWPVFSLLFGLARIGACSKLGAG